MQTRLWSFRKRCGTYFPRKIFPAITPILVTELLKELECPSAGNIQTDNNALPCEIFMYRFDLKRNKTYKKNDDILFGPTDKGDLISQEDCEKILSLPVKSCEEDRKTAYWLKLTSTSRDRLPDVLEESIKNNYVKEQEHSFNADIDLIKIKAGRQKSVLEQEVELVRTEVAKIKETLANASDRLEELKMQKQVSLLANCAKRKKACFWNKCALKPPPRMR